MTRENARPCPELKKRREASRVGSGCGGLERVQAVLRMAPLIAQTVRQQRTLEGFLWLAAVVIVGTTLLALLAFLKRKRDAVSGRRALPFTVNELRKLRDGGKISPEEYEALKRRVLCGSGD